MKQIQSNIDELVLRIKRDEPFSDICFVKGFNTQEHPNPLTGYLIAVSTLDTQVGTQFVADALGENMSGSMYNATLKFRLYAPKNDGGDGLSTLAYELCESIKKCDTLNVLEDIKVSGIAFDNDANTVYRDVVAQLSFCIYEEVTG